VSRYFRVAPAPKCPRCASTMRLRRPREHDNWFPFWGCSAWPQCTATLEIEIEDSAQMNLLGGAIDYEGDPEWEPVENATASGMAHGGW
jgi:ssDNA-binding Zn-finger/Zn-ribbon topoisomerase 1